jgi:hypothetical protein
MEIDGKIVACIGEIQAAIADRRKAADLEENARRELDRASENVHRKGTIVKNLRDELWRLVGGTGDVRCPSPYWHPDPSESPFVTLEQRAEPQIVEATP